LFPFLKCLVVKKYVLLGVGMDLVWPNPYPNAKIGCVFACASLLAAYAF
jgi:hypothetical protein